jgi:RNA polymerase sigma-70 factor (ECF subfamily)
MVDTSDDNSIIGEASDYIKALLKLLPEDYSKPLYMSDIEGIEQKTIAKNLELSLSNTKSRIQRARVKLKEQFLECCVVSFGEGGEMISFDIKPECTMLKEEQTRLQNKL